MTYTPIPKGTQDWDVPVNSAFTSQDSRITVTETTNATQNGRLDALELRSSYRTTPSDFGYLSWNYDPVMAGGGSQPANGVLQMTSLYIPQTVSVSNVIVGVTIVGSGFTASQNFAGLYNSSGTLIDTTADQSTNWSSVGPKVMPLATSHSLSPGTYHVAMLVNATTRPSFHRTGSFAGLGSIVNQGLTATTYRFATSGSALTSLPSSVTMSGRSVSDTTWWVAVS